VHKALELDANLAEAHAVLGLLDEQWRWDWAAGDSEFKRALQLNPGLATTHHWYSGYFARMGRFDEAVAEAQRAVELDPLGVPLIQNLGNMYEYAHQFDRAIEQYKKGIQLDPGFNDSALYKYIAFIYGMRQQNNEAAEALREGASAAARPDIKR